MTTTQERPGVNPEPSEIAQRAVILQLLRDDHDERWAVAELQAEIRLEPTALEGALKDLEVHGVSVSLDDWVLVSRSVRQIDELGLIGI